MTIGMPEFVKDPCANVNMTSFATGAAISALRLDGLFASFGAPPGVHWALGGIGAEYYCKGKVQPSQDTAMAAAAAYAGGFVSTMLMG